VGGIPASADRGIFGATDTRTGTVVWQIHVPQPAVSGLAVAGDVLFFGASDGTFLGVSALTGHILCSFDYY
jgi:outer membrane protein assembly factor BamB